MALTPAQWSDELRASIAQLVGAMRHIQSMNQAAEWKPYFDGWMADVSISKDTRKTIKHLLPAVLSMAEDIDDFKLSELGINPLGMPISSPFSANQDIESSDFKIAQIDLIEKPSTSNQMVLMLSKPNRTVRVSIYDATGLQMLVHQNASEILAGVYIYHIDWSVLAVVDGNYYVVLADDGYQMDAKTVEMKTAATESHTQADKVWMLQNVRGNAPTATADGHFI